MKFTIIDVIYYVLVAILITLCFTLDDETFAYYGAVLGLGVFLGRFSERFDQNKSEKS